MDGLKELLEHSFHIEPTSSEVYGFLVALLFIYGLAITRKVNLLHEYIRDILHADIKSENRTAMALEAVSQSFEEMKRELSEQRKELLEDIRNNLKANERQDSENVE